MNTIYAVIALAILVCVIGLVAYFVLFLYKDNGFRSFYKSSQFLFMVNDGPDLKKDIPALKSEFVYLQSCNDMYIEV